MQTMMPDQVWVFTAMDGTVVACSTDSYDRALATSAVQESAPYIRKRVAEQAQEDVVRLITALRTIRILMYQQGCMCAGEGPCDLDCLAARIDTIARETLAATVTTDA